jgi:hypothetical protein
MVPAWWTAGVNKARRTWLVAWLQWLWQQNFCPRILKWSLVTTDTGLKPLMWLTFWVFVTNSMKQSSCWETGSCLAGQKKHPASYKTWRLITIFRKTYHCSLPSANWIQARSSYSSTLRPILIQGGFLPAGLQSGSHTDSRLGPDLLHLCRGTNW